MPWYEVHEEHEIWCGDKFQELTGNYHLSLKKFDSVDIARFASGKCVAFC